MSNWEVREESVEAQGNCRFWDPSFEWISWSQNIWYDTPSVPRKIVVDPRHGTWAGLASRALKAVFPNSEVVAIHDRPHADFRSLPPRVVDPDSLDAIASTIRSECADIGFALDVDAGHFRVIDDEGEPLSLDETHRLFLQMLGPTLEGERVLLDGRTAEKSIDEIKRFGCTPIEGPSVCHEDFILKMKHTEALIGFGSEGDVYYRGIQGNRIVLFAFCWILDYLGYLGRPLSWWRSNSIKL